MIDVIKTESPDDEITITMTRSQAKEISFGLSDVCCWAAGFKAGRVGSFEDDGPMSVEKLREINNKIKDSLA